MNSKFNECFRKDIQGLLYKRYLGAVKRENFCATHTFYFRKLVITNHTESRRESSTMGIQLCHFAFERMFSGQKERKL